MKRIVVFALFLLAAPALRAPLAAAAPPAGQAQQPATRTGVGAPATHTADVADPLLALLGDYERVITPELVAWLIEQQGRDTLVERLRALAADRGHKRYLRLRATSLLASFPGEETKAFLAQQAAASDDPEVRIQSVIAYGHAVWPAEPEAARRWLEAKARDVEPKLAATARRTLENLQATAPARPGH